MRILNVTASYSPFLEFGGPPVKVHALAHRLAQRGHQVSVLSADWGIEARLPSLPPETRADRSPFGWRLQEGPVQAIYLPTWLRYHAVSWNPALRRYCRARLANFDIVHIFGLYDLLGPAVAAACRSQGLPYVVEPIGMFLPIVRNFWLKRMYHLALGRPLLRGASTLIATSQQEVEELAVGGLPRDKIVLRPNGVAAPAAWPAPGEFRTAHRIPRDAWMVLFLGRLSAKKSPELLLNAFAAIPERLGGKEVHLVFAGPDEGSMAARLLQQAAQLAVSPRVHFTGPVFDAAKWSAYRDADVFVLPSQNENFGNTAAESVAAGTPVVVTRQCGIAPVLRDRAGLVVNHDARELAAAIRVILDDPGTRTRLQSACAAVAAELSWDAPVAQMEILYAGLLAKKQFAHGQSQSSGAWE
jgi:glycosyltransferase involved in cell wall biosynthesis